tara:strand:+ start:59 stop:268 length:210 start_codon:yes stop_codon:yes gene_type:complete
MFVDPSKTVTTPTGATARAKIVERNVGGDVYTEAQWYDPISGMLAQRGTVKIEFADGSVQDAWGRKDAE